MLIIVVVGVYLNAYMSGRLLGRKVGNKEKKRRKKNNKHFYSIVHPSGIKVSIGRDSPAV